MSRVRRETELVLLDLRPAAPLDRVNEPDILCRARVQRRLHVRAGRRPRARISVDAQAVALELCAERAHVGRRAARRVSQWRAYRSSTAVRPPRARPAWMHVSVVGSQVLPLATAVRNTPRAIHSTASAPSSLWLHGMSRGSSLRNHTRFDSARTHRAVAARRNCQIWQRCIFCVSSSSGHEQCSQHAILMAVVLMPLAIRYEPTSASQKSAF